MGDRPNWPGLTTTLDRDVLEPIAIVGFSIRFPGDADSAESFWKLMAERRCTSSKFPRNRVNVDAFYHPDSARLDSVPMHNAHFLDGDLGAFDAPFFSITPSEALSMDPQHRGLLETAYRALENAGIPLQKVDGTSAGVFTGSFGDDYRISTLKDVACMPKHAATGLGQNFSANRLSWAFNLKGPSIQIDTACSSSLIALDMACQSLRNRDSTMALVCGSNVISSIESFMTLSNMGFLSPDGKCYSFDSRGNGYARGEGFGVLVVKLLSDAIRDRDNIRAVVRSSGSNQNGKTRSITQTSKADQIKLIKHTYDKAGLDYRHTRFVEAHGTGTALGDPVEASVIGEVFGKYQDAEDVVYVGAVKSNVGHLEGASGIAGIVKAILVLERGIIPPNTNFERLNPKIKANMLNIRFPTTSTPWPAPGLRRVSINSFGFGGSNSHVVLDDAFNYLRERGLKGNHCTVETPQIVERSSLSPDHGHNTVNGLSSLHGQRLTNGSRAANGDSHYGTNGLVNGNSESSLSRSLPRILLFSATNETSVKRLIAAYSGYFQESSGSKLCKDTYLDNLAYTLSDRRTHLTCRSFAILDHTSALSELTKLITKPNRSSSKLGMCFVFSGQGAQYSGMGKDLINYPAFKKTLVRAQSILSTLGCGWSIIDELLKDENNTQMHSPEFSQPLCTVLQIALVELLRDCGIRPAVVVGHSSGEIAAAYAAGALSIVSACKAAYYRGRYSALLSKSAPRRGAMLAVGLSKLDAQGYLNRLNGGNNIVVACINSPKSVTISGDEHYVDMLKSILDTESVFNRKLKVGVAYHSSHMEQIASHYADSLHFLEPGDSAQYDAMMVSSVTGEPVSAEVLSDKKYWVENLVSPVQFSEAFGCIAANSRGSQKSRRSGLPPVHHILEVGPHSTLQGPVRDILAQFPAGTELSYFSTLNRNDSAISTFLNLAGELWSRGYDLDVVSLNHPDNSTLNLLQVLTDLPQYSFDHTNSFFHLPRYQKDFLLRELPSVDLLGTPVLGWNPLEPTWRKILGVKDASWIEDHVVNGTILFPAAGMLVMAIEAARLMAPPDRKLTGMLIKEATFSHSLTIPSDETGVETRLHLKPLPSSNEHLPEGFEFSLYSISSEKWIRNCYGALHLEYEQDDPIQKASLPRPYLSQGLLGPRIDRDSLYENFRSSGLQYGPAFQALNHASFTTESIAYAEVAVFPHDEDGGEISQQNHIIHPVTLDALAQVALVALTKGGNVFASTNVPTAVRDLWISGKGVSGQARSTIGAYAETIFHGDHQNEFSVTAVDTVSGETLVSMSRLETTNIGGLTDHHTREQQQCYVVEVKPDIDLLDGDMAREYCMADSETKSTDVAYSNDLDFYMIGMFRRVVAELKESEIDLSRPHYQSYYRWAQCRVRDFEKMASSEQLRTTADVTLLESAQFRIEAAGYEGKFYSQVGRNLLDILRGKVDPLAVLFEAGLARDLYQEVNMRISGPLTRLMELLSHKTPNMNIIEVGAGTGGTSEVILKATERIQRDGTVGSRFSWFDYTDLSASFFEGAKGLFQKYASNMAFRVLDVESEPISQGFTVGSYDMVLAANVLHATRSLKTTLRNVRSLLKPGGKLVLVEVTNKFHRAGFGMGLLPGWWLSTDDFRVDGPCISKGSWHEALRATGFSGVDLSLSDHEDDIHHELSILVATAVDSETVTPHSQLDVCILLEDECATQEKTAQAIQKIYERTMDKGCCQLYLKDATPDRLSNKFVISLLEVESPQLNCLDQQHFQSIQSVLTQAAGVLWVNSGDVAESDPIFKMVDGLRRTVTSENSDLVFVTLALGAIPSPGSMEDCAELVFSIYQKTISGSVKELEEEYIREGKTVYIKRVVEASRLNHHMDEQTNLIRTKDIEFGHAPPLRLDFECPGVIDSLRFIEDPRHETQLEMNEVEIEVNASGLIFRDCLVALNRLKASSSSIGAEFSGTIARVAEGCNYKVGDAVYGFTTSGSFGSIVRTSADLIAPIPHGLSFLDTAGLPIAFGTVHHALVEIARLEKGETILIHSAAGGTGQAAIQVAQYLGAEVYATVGTPKKKQLLMDRYNIPEERIFSSRSTKFAQSIKVLTNGEGVDVILNSLSGEKLTASWESIAPFGRFIEIGKRDIMTNSKLPMLPFLKNVSFCVVDLFGMIQQRPKKVKRILDQVNELLREGHISSPYPLTVYGVGSLEDAFRDMQSGTNSGKIVVEMKKTEVVKAVLQVRPSWYFDPNASYLIAGGFGGVARSIARWMASRGAKHLILLSRSGPKPGKSAELVQDLKEQGVWVEAPACDVSSEDMVIKVLRDCEDAGMPPIKGCIQGSMVLRDAIFANMKWEDWDAVQKPRVQGTLNLHRHLPRGMDFFVMLSSVAGVTGTRGQANYAAANSFLDAFTRHRIMQGEKATSIDLGWVESEGTIAENQDLQRFWISVGCWIPVSQSELYSMLDYYCDPAIDNLTVENCQAVIGVCTPSMMHSKGFTELPAFLNRPMFSPLRLINATGASDSTSINNANGGSAESDYSALYKNAASAEEAVEHIMAALVRRIAKAMAMPAEDIDPRRPLHAYGVDSLLGIELRTWFKKFFGIEITVFEILGAKDFALLAELAVQFGGRFIEQNNA